MKSQRNKFVSTISAILLSCVIMMLTVSFASASEITALTEDNIAVWPTFEGEMFYGQKLNEGNLQVVGGVVTLDGTADGTVVAGHFEFTDPEYRPTQITGNYASITFIPDDKDSYAGFTVSENENAVYAISKTTPVLQDPVNDPPVASQIAAGKRVMISKLSGGALMNPYTKEVIAGTKWAWAASSRTKVVNESAYYQAGTSLGTQKDYYNTITMYVYVRIEGDTAEEKMLTTVVEEPTITTTKFTVGDAWASIAFTGGKVVDLNGIEVEGKFEIPTMGTIQAAGNVSCQFVFTPSDGYYSKASFAIKIVVDPCPISFGPDYKGTSIDDPYVFEVAPGTEMSVVLEELKFHHLNYPGTGTVAIENQHGQAEHGRTYEYRVLNYNNANYTGKYAYVKTVFTETQVSPTIAWAGFNEYKVDCGTHRPSGTFTIFCNDVEIAEEKVGQPFTCEVYTDAGGTYNIVAKYNPVDGDYFVCSDATYSVTVAPKKNITYQTSTTEILVNGHVSFNEIREGDEVVMKNTYGTFVNWIIKDANGKTVTLDGVDVNEREISFIMPDYDLVFTYRMQEDIEREEAIANCDHLCHSDNELIRLFWNILRLFFRLLNVQQYCDCGDTHYKAPLVQF